MKERLHQMEAVFEHSCDGMSIVDRNGNIVLTNPAMMRLYRLSLDEYVGRNVDDLVREGLFNTSVSKKVIASGHTVSILQEIRTGVKCLTTGVPIFGADGEIEMIVVNSHDVTELYALKEKLRRSNIPDNEYLAEFPDIHQLQREGIVVRSKKMLDALNLARRLASLDATVLITGESGVGKEVVATILHKDSPRRSGHSFVKINCGAIPPSLLESEFFGYEYGAFTGAAKEGRTGLFELADGGSIFLDEISELSPDLQVKLLRVLQEREFTRIGSSKVIKVDVRVIAATNKNILEIVSNGSFRQDLYYRLNVVPLNIPPLRERKEDIVALAQHYVRHFNKLYGFEKVLQAELIDVMENYPWNGNVRELINFVERMVVTSRGNILRVEEFPVEAPDSNDNDCSTESVFNDRDMKQILGETEKRMIATILKQNKNCEKAAEAMGISRATLARKMRKYGIKMRSVS
jgi:PAS domain S-box-containing protein